jgi:hypothetical protein
MMREENPSARFKRANAPQFARRPAEGRLKIDPWVDDTVRLRRQATEKVRGRSRVNLGQQL